MDGRTGILLADRPVEPAVAAPVEALESQSTGETPAMFADTWAPDEAEPAAVLPATVGGAEESQSTGDTPATLPSWDITW